MVTQLTSRYKNHHLKRWPFFKENKLMDKKLIEKFAVKARQELIESVRLKLSLIGIDKTGVHEKLPESTDELEIYASEGSKLSGQDIIRRKAIVNRLNQLADAGGWIVAYEQFIEEVAYTWFNQIIAIRFMEVNNYLPSNRSVLSSDLGYNEPDILHDAFDVEQDLGGFSNSERKVIKVALDDQLGPDLDKAYQILFLKQVDALNKNLPVLFEKTKDYLQLLFTPRYSTGVIHELVEQIPKSDFDVQQAGQVEIIGWLYQYYNEAPKDKAFKKKKYGTYDIPAVTQLFTPDWIVKYLVENSLGRYWADILHSRGDSRSEKEIANDFGWKYYMPEAKQKDATIKIVSSSHVKLQDLSPEDISFIDPAMGSGHILVYAFDVFMKIYESEGYSQRQSAHLIIQKNLIGLDIDTRAYQLSYFAVMMKARQYDRKVLGSSIAPRVYDIPEIDISDDRLNDFLGTLPDNTLGENDRSQLEMIIDQFRDGNELGSLINLREQRIDFDKLLTITNPGLIKGQLSLDSSTSFTVQGSLRNMLDVAEVLSSQYSISVTNPPYMAHGKMPKQLAKFADKKFPNSKSDLFAMFIERLKQFTIQNGYYALITQHQWMFLSSYERLRNIINNLTLINMAHLGTHAFEEIGGEVVQSTAFVMRQEKTIDYIGAYERLVNFGSQQKKQDAFLNAIANPEVGYLYHTDQSSFAKIPGSPIAYWISKNLIHDFEVGTPMGELVDPKVGLQTGNNVKFLRQWFEVDINKIKFDANSIADSIASHKKWFPYNKGGAYRKWYGNYEYVVDWENDGQNIRRDKLDRLAMGKILASNSKPKNTKYYFRKSLTWSEISSGSISFRHIDGGAIPDIKGPVLVPKSQSNIDLLELLAYSNSVVSNIILKILSPTLDFTSGAISKLPLRKINSSETMRTVKSITQELIEESKKDWDSFETSWDFDKHPLIINNDSYYTNEFSPLVQQHFENWSEKASTRFKNQQLGEEQLNRIFINLYQLQDLLEADVQDDEVSVRKSNLVREVKSLLSYFIGIIFGRYSLNQSGLVYAGGNWDSSKYKIYIPNSDNVVILTDFDYFDDKRDIMFRFKGFLRQVYGQQHLRENIEYIADALGKRKMGVTPEQQIRNYFFNDFYKKDHVKTYRKRPIYWELNSGSQGGFRALIYLHRYDENTMATIRTSYLHPLQAAYENKLAQLKPLLDSETSTKAKNQLQKQIDKITKQRDELIKFDAKLQHVANMHIKIDLDDGVVVNHEKVQGGENILSPIK